MIENFKVLDDRSHVLLRPGVYLGSVLSEKFSGIINYSYQEKTIVPALIKMVEEVYQNSIDHAIKNNFKAGNAIDISIKNILAGTEITVTDNGNGIPISKVNDTYIPVLAWTTLRAGSNFDDDNRVGAGTNGMGVSLVNIFSKEFTGTTADGKHKMIVNCSNNMTTTNTRHMVSCTKGTSVSFIPDLARFGLTEFTQDHIDVIRDRISNLAILYPQISFTFCSEKFSFKNIKAVGKLFSESAVTYESNNISLVFGPSGTDEEFRLLSYVNGIYVKNGGSHVDFILSKIIETLREHVKKKHKIEVLPNHIKQHLLFASWLSKFPALQFDSQSKERVTNTYGEVSTFLKDIDFDKISKQILNTPEIIDPIISAILYKKEQAERLALQKKQKSVSKLRIVNHIAATDPNPENRILYIVEGLSAVGCHISVRNPLTDGAFPLKGKVMNVRGMKPVNIIKNKEISELLSIIGLEFGKPATNLNYGKIAIFSDLDTDGDHIFGLLLNLFSNWSELFYEKRIVRSTAPLYYCTKGKQVKAFFTKEEYDAFDSKGWVVEYFKGLGSMPKEVYKECLQNPRFIRINVKDSDDFSHLEMAFGNDVSKRKEWMLK